MLVSLLHKGLINNQKVNHMIEAFKEKEEFETASSSIRLNQYLRPCPVYFSDF